MNRRNYLQTAAFGWSLLLPLTVRPVRTPRDQAVSTPVFSDHRLLIAGLMFKLDVHKPAASVLRPETRAVSKRILLVERHDIEHGLRFPLQHVLHLDHHTRGEIPSGAGSP